MKRAGLWTGGLCLAVVFGGFAPEARAAKTYTETVDGITWTYTISDGKATIGPGRDYSFPAIPQSTSGAISIPAVLGGYPVTHIGDYAFSSCSCLTGVTIPDSVTSIGESVFSGCTGLQTLYVPWWWTRSARVEVAGVSAGCRVVYGGTEVVGGVEWTFYTTNGQAVVTGGPREGTMDIPGILGGCPVTGIGEEAFAYYGLTAVRIPDSVTDIRGRAFCECYGLTNVAIGNSVTHIGGGAFCYCTNLTSVMIPDSVRNIGDGAFEQCMNLTNVTIPNGVTNIGNSAFFDCGLEVLEVPDSLRWMGDEAFAWCQNLKSVVIRGVKIIPYGAFSSCGSIESLTMEEGITEIHDYAFGNVEGYYSCRLKELRIPDSVTYLGYRAFGMLEYKYLDSLTLGAGLTDFNGWHVAGEDFGCDRLTVMCNVTNEWVGFPDYRHLSFGEGVWNIGPFLSCAGDVEVADGNPWYVVEDGVMFSKDRKTLVWHPGRSGATYFVPDGVTKIGKYAFWYNVEDARVVIPRGVTEIEEGAFDQECYIGQLFVPASWRGTELAEGLPSWLTVRFHETVDGEEWGYSVDGGVATVWAAFDAGTDAWIPETLGGVPVTGIGEGAFSGCAGLLSVMIPEGVATIGAQAFQGCEGLSELVLPADVTSLGNGAFDGCSGLRTIWVPGTWITSGGAELLQQAGLPSGCTVRYRETETTETVEGVEWRFRTDRGEAIVLAGGYAGTLAVPGELGGCPVAEIGWRAFWECTELSGVTIPGSVDAIGAEAFSGCIGLRTLTIPSGVTDIGRNALSGCTGLELLYVPSWWEGSGKVENAGVPQGCRVVYGSPEEVGGVEWLYGVVGGQATVISGPTNGIAAIPAVLGGYPVTAIGQRAFYGCGGLAGVAIPDSVVCIGGEAFDGCSSGIYDTQSISGLRLVDGWAVGTTDGLSANVDLAGIRGIAGLAFQDCTGLESVLIPDGVAGIGSGAFRGCSNLTSVAIPDSVASIGREAFDGCSPAIYDTESIAGLRLVDGWVVGITDGISANVDLTGIRGIADDAFAECSALTGVTIPNGISRIGSGAFAGCISLESLTIPRSVASIGWEAFSGCSGLKTLYVPDSLKSLDACHFFGATVDAHSGIRIIYYGDTVAAPVISPAGGIVSVSKPCAVTITCATEGAEIYYSTNGVTPRPTAAYRYAGPFEIGSPAFVKAVAVLAGVKSGYASAVFTGPLPAVETEAEVAAALSECADPRLARHIVTVEDYGEFRAWLAEKEIDAQAVQDSSHAWPSFALGAEGLFQNEPEIMLGGVEVESNGSKAGGGMALTVAVTVKDGGSEVSVDAAKVAALFECTDNLADWTGGAAAKPAVTFKEGDGAVLRFEVVPGDGISGRAFLRIGE